MATNVPPPAQPDPYAQQGGGFTQGSVRQGALQGGGGGGAGGGSRGRKPFFLTSEFMVLVATVVLLLIAAAVSDDFDAPQMWTLVTAVAFAYIVSRGLAKHEHPGSGDH